MNLTEQIRKLRTDNDLTIEQFAEKLKADAYPISISTVNKWFRPTKPQIPQPTHIKRIETVFGITFDVTIKPNSL